MSHKSDERLDIFERGCWDQLLSQLTSLAEGSAPAVAASQATTPQEAEDLMHPLLYDLPGLGSSSVPRSASSRWGWRRARQRKSPQPFGKSLCSRTRPRLSLRRHPSLLRAPRVQKSCPLTASSKHCAVRHAGQEQG